MKNEIILTVVVIVICAISGINITMNVNCKKISSLKLSETDALTQEGSSSYPYKSAVNNECTLYKYYCSAAQSYISSTSTVNESRMVYQGTVDGDKKLVLMLVMDVHLMVVKKNDKINAIV
jgi:hypothetical protein